MEHQDSPELHRNPTIVGWFAIQYCTRAIFSASGKPAKTLSTKTGARARERDIYVDDD